MRENDVIFITSSGRDDSILSFRRLMKYMFEASIVFEETQENSAIFKITKNRYGPTTGLCIGNREECLLLVATYIKEQRKRKLQNIRRTSRIKRFNEMFS